MKKGQLVASLTALAAFIYLLAKSLKMQNHGAFWTGPGAMPTVLSASLLFFCLIWLGDLVWEYMKNRARNVQGTMGKAAAMTKKEWKRLGLIVFLTLFYVYALTPLIGFIAATVVFLLGSILLFGEMHWLKSLLISGVVSLAVYVTFNYLLHLPMPR